VQTTSTTQTCSSSAQLTKIFQDLFKVAPADLRDEIKMSDLEMWDSLRHMELIASIEQSYGIELTLDEISSMQGVSEIRKVLADRGISA
jgi:acyl carrier protein